MGSPMQGSDPRDALRVATLWSTGLDLTWSVQSPTMIRISTLYIYLSFDDVFKGNVNTHEWLRFTNSRLPRKEPHYARRSYLGKHTFMKVQATQGRVLLFNPSYHEVTKLSWKTYSHESPIYSRKGNISQSNLSRSGVASRSLAIMQASSHAS
ncbi:hypothetical protein H5410_045461 [Solanum commersonii]|uniref:Uncharacterized protein n=1 Tax=Solanum commersonii TaxID=4109 RepID=A0A9J5X9N6_SOLCO|nr:hypothetical protein H5410_045461 [Solanum commersonii]